MTRELGVGHLTLIAHTPPEVVSLAAAAGFDFVGLRVKAVTATERAYDMSLGSPLLAETVLRLNDTGLTVRDIEFLPLTPTTTREDWLPALDSGAALGASAFTVTGADPDRNRLHDTLANLVDDGVNVGIRPVLEPISYQPVSTVADAATLARETGAALMLDALHIVRGGSSLDDVRALEAHLVPVVQLCDGPLDLGTTDIAALQHEARIERGVIGTGEFALDDLLLAVPDGTPGSVEIPHVGLQALLSPSDYLALMARTARELFARVEAAPTIGERA